MKRDSRDRFKVRNDAEQVKIRFRVNSNGAWSIYFDTYISGQRKKESTGRELVIERTPIDKVQNENTMTAVRAMRADRVKAIANGQANISMTSKYTLYTYMSERSEKISIYTKYLLRYIKPMDTKLTSVDAKYVERLFGSIDKAKSKGWVNLLYAILSKTLKLAYKDGLVDNIATKYVSFKDICNGFADRKEMSYLTIDELKAMEEYLPNAEGSYNLILKLFLFSCYTGLRRSDIRDLRVEHIVMTDGVPTYIVKRQVKTKAEVRIPISAKALRYMPDLSDKGYTDNVFSFLNYTSASVMMSEIAVKAGIRKHVNFHTARHTFATMALTLGGDIYTVSSLLGHASITTTQVYAKIVDDKRKEVTDLFNKL